MEQGCPGCGGRRPLAAVLRRQPVARRGGGSFAPVAEAARHPLCAACSEWLWQVVSSVATGLQPVVGAPGPAGRARVFDDQCAFCRELLGRDATAVTAIALGPAGQQSAAMYICDACDVWLAGIADDSRSARGEAERAIDGAYGRWPYPNLRDLVVAFDILDAATRETLTAACAQMGVRAVPAGKLANPAVLAVESAATRPALGPLRAAAPGTQRIALVPPGGMDDLRDCLAAGIDCWLTIPLTPQQLMAALARLVRQPGLQARWDLQTCLPFLDAGRLERGLLRVLPAPDLDPAQAAWLVRRVSRGYDDIGSIGGEIAVIPRAPEALLERIAERLQRALADRCIVLAAAGSGLARPRFEATG